MRLASVAAVTAIVLSVPGVVLAQHHPVPSGNSCDPSPNGDTLHCRLTVEFKGGQWTTEPIVWFDAPTNVKIVWKMKHRAFGTKYGFKNDSLLVPANVTGFSNTPCSSDDDDKCPGSNDWHPRYIWIAVNPGSQQFDYQLKLYPEDPSLLPIIVKVKAAAKSPADPNHKPGKKPKGPVWVDPTIVIQG